MENVSYVSLSGLIALERRMDVIANNIANMDTNGYQGQETLFEEFISDEQKNTPLTMVYNYGAYRNLTEGPIVQTGNTLDVALSGPGYLSVQTPSGGTGYSRNGSMQLNTNGELVNSSGQLVLSQGGSSIVIPQGAKDVRIDSQGRISADGAIVGELGVVEFENPQNLELIGGGLMTGGNQTTALPAENTQVFQGMIEKSNVNPISEITEMIEVSRRYQAAASLMQQDHERQRDAIRQLSQN